MKIWVDADSCPVVIREILYRAAERKRIELILVANQHLSLPGSRYIRLLQVSSGFDVADNEIVRRVEEGDLVITSDIPLAAEVIDKKGRTLSPRGELLTEQNVKSRLNMRDFMDTLRGSGVHTGGPPALSQSDRQAFANHLDRILAKVDGGPSRLLLNVPPAGPAPGFVRRFSRVIIPPPHSGPRNGEHSMSQAQRYDVIVVGGGHAGTEAALAGARMGCRTLLLTHNIETVGQMSCNPAIGGIGKGHIVKEIDALGGAMARAADRGGIQFRTLNARKGPAVRATRAQADRVLYKQAIRRLVESQPDLFVFQQGVDDLVIEGGRVAGVVTQMGLRFDAPTVVLTTGTFLGGKIHIGASNYQGGRAGDPPANTLAARLREMPFRVGRLKTGTPPRIDGGTLDYTAMVEQPGDEPAPVFSYLGSVDEHPEQISCHITYTNERTHDLIRAGLDRSPMFSGEIEGVGPRYCPSIEDKVVRFADKTAHQIFVEPEGLESREIYPNGISTSLPFDIQQALVRTIAGFENAHITRPGYAIEYDYFDPRDLRPTLETQFIEGLYFAGQINGTTGYEEAAGQGLVAGINAGLRVRGKDAWWPRRDESYIGVLIDDLITRGTREPYRMFTSRAEYRLMLREDNADLRLTETGRALGVVDDARWRAFSEKRETLERERQRLSSTWLRPSSVPPAEQQRVFGQALSRDASLMDLLRRPEVRYFDLVSLDGAGPGEGDPRVIEQLEIEARYAGYIDRQHEEIARLRRNEETVLPDDLDYSNVRGLSTEIQQKLNEHRPATIGQASRISGVTPAAVSLLLVHLKKRAA